MNDAKTLVISEVTARLRADAESRCSEITDATSFKQMFFLPRSAVSRLSPGSLEGFARAACEEYGRLLREPESRSVGGKVLTFDTAEESAIAYVISLLMLHEDALRHSPVDKVRISVKGDDEKATEGRRALMGSCTYTSRGNGYITLYLTDKGCLETDGKGRTLDYERTLRHEIGHSLTMLAPPEPFFNLLASLDTLARRTQREDVRELARSFVEGVRSRRRAAGSFPPDMVADRKGMDDRLGRECAAELDVMRTLSWNVPSVKLPAGTEESTDSDGSKPDNPCWNALSGEFDVCLGGRLDEYLQRAEAQHRMAMAFCAEGKAPPYIEWTSQSQKTGTSTITEVDFTDR